MALVLLIAAAGCDGTDVRIGTRAINARTDAGSPALQDVATASATICLADSDCAPLATAPCAQAVCEPQSHRCLVVPKPDFSGCDTGQACEVGACLAAACVPIEYKDAADCDDGNPCTQDGCQNKTGCVHVPAPYAACSDGNPCTTDDACLFGSCVATVNACSCTSDLDCNGFAGQDKCVGALLCSQGACVLDPAAATPCDDQNLCTTDGCDAKTGACTHTPVGEGTQCNDGNVCTLGERCQAGVCKANGTLPCNSNGSGCPMVCDPQAGCLPDAASATCDDGNPCTKGDACQAGACVGTPSCGCQTDVDCNSQAQMPLCGGKMVCTGGACVVDANLAEPCTQTGAPGQPLAGCEMNLCTAGGCALAQKPTGTPCDANAYCTYGDHCTAQGKCEAGVQLQCADNNECTTDFCDLATVNCVHSPDASKEGKLCNDGNPCTVGETCAKTACAAGKPACNDGDPCTADLCDPTAKSACLHKILPAGAVCDDGDACTQDGLCQGGTCVFALVQTCDDGNPCTEDSCVDGGGCAHNAVKTSEPVTCDDGDSCTKDDTCIGGACKGLPGACQCQGTKDCATFEDGNLCNGTLQCVDHACAVDPGTLVACAPSVNPCATVQCQPTTGTCTEIALVTDAGGNPIACNDGNACTSGDACLPGGVCGAGKPLQCADGNACTFDTCDTATGCVFPPYQATAGVPCDDGNPCTFGDVCSPGGCAAGKNACQCQTDADCVAYDDGNACNGGLICKAGICAGDGKTVTCPAATGPCVATQCDPSSGGCLTTAIPDGTLCDSAVNCASGGQCQAGSCVGAVVQGCDDLNDCTQDVCLPMGCTHTASTGAVCDDGNVCTTGEKCGATGQCGNGTNTCSCKADGDCPDDGDLCNGVYVCNGGTCQPKSGSVVVCDTAKDNACQKNACEKKSGVCQLAIAAAGSACDDGDACTKGEACAGGQCAGATAIGCDDANPCTLDGCNPANGCYHQQNNGACDDGNPCTLGDVCSAGVCAGQGACDCATDADCVAKDDGNLCNGILKCGADKHCKLDLTTVVTCDPASQTDCSVPVCAPTTGVCGPTPVPDGTGCSDGDACTTKDQCVKGKCSGSALNCNDSNVCTNDQCDSKIGCVLTANTATCDDGNACTAGDVCVGGSCTSGKNTCGTCAIDSDCKDDGDLCNGTVMCSAGQCVPKPNSAVTCTAGTACSTNVCQAATGKCVATSIATGTPCDDGTACTSSSACFGGACVGQGNLNCDDGNVCTTDSCDAKIGCLHGPSLGPCDDNNPCTQGDVCNSQSKCASGTNQCACLQDGDCKQDSNACNGVLVCQANQCVVKAGSVPVCDTSKDTTCLKTACDPKQGMCIAGLVDTTGKPCDDGSLCTTGDACAAGSCAGKALACDDGNPCTLDSCDAKLGCQHPAANGAICDDGNACTKGDICNAGQCAPGANGCQCQVTSDCGKFEDGNACNGTLICSANQCVIDAKTVITCGATGSGCTAATCDPKSGTCLANPVGDGQPCGGAELCGGSGSCKAGTCTGANACADDGNPCTTAACDGKGGCSQAASSGPCTDNNNCTIGDTCSGGACKPGANQCNCATNKDCAKFDDGNLCNGTYSCNAGQCQPDPTTVITCPPAADACVVNACDPSQGKCITQNAPDGTGCDDNNACTTSGQCFAGACLVKPVSCNDNNPCTSDSCDAAGGCAHKNVPTFPQPTSCDDGNPCTVLDICQNGKCTGLGFQCQCKINSDCKDDATKCNGYPTCQGGQCKTDASTVVTCDASGDTPCVKNLCVPSTGACQKLPAPPGTTCDDNSSCTGGDVCALGQCIGVKLDCQDNVACTLDSCDPKQGCVHVANNSACNDNDACTNDVCDAIGGCLHQGVTGGACDDGNPCTQGETCGIGPAGTKCFGGTPLNCDDKNACTADSCDQTLGCVYTNVGGPCDDGNPCTVLDSCAGGQCGGKKLSCEDNNACTTDSCTGSGCAHVASGAVICNDNDACTTGDFCKGTVCVPGSKKSCDDGQVCTFDFCDTLTAQCLHNQQPNCCMSNADCTDGNACTVDTCDATSGKCSFSGNGDPTCCNKAADCNDNNACTADSCNGNKCTFVSGGVPGCCNVASDCDDGDACTTDACTANKCTHAAMACDDGNACTTDTCSGGKCVFSPGNGPCTDLNPCTNDSCVSGVCTTAPKCDDGLACNTDSCDATGACLHTVLPGFSADFEDGTTGGITAQTLFGSDKWTLDKTQSASGNISLYVGVVLPNGVHTYNQGAGVANAILPGLVIPAGAGSAKMTYNLFFDRDPSESPGCTGFVDTVQVLLGITPLTPGTCSNTGKFVPVTIDLTSQVGKAVALSINFLSNLTQNNGQGAWIDDVKVSWSCP